MQCYRTWLVPEPDLIGQPWLQLLQDHSSDPCISNEKGEKIVVKQKNSTRFCTSRLLRLLEPSHPPFPPSQAQAAFLDLRVSV